MFFRMIYDDGLAQAAYLLGCERTGEAIVVDPERDVDRYIAAAAAAGLRITAVAETHVHADFVSGARELAARAGARVLVSGAGGDDWTPRWLADHDHRVLRHGDTIDIGGVRLRAIHTPGHTPEHLAYLVTDTAAGSEPLGLLSGDFLFVGDVGRPDLLETAVGAQGAAQRSARDLFASLSRALELPDFAQVWPGHGAGSACGKALGAVPQSTIGYERRTNAALRAAGDERGFIDFVLAGQPEPPLYFARMKRVNRDGPAVLGRLPEPPRLAPADLRASDPARTAIIDTRPWREFSSGHLPRSLYIPLGKTFSTEAASFVAEDEPVVLVVTADRLDAAVRSLIRVGVDRIAGWLPPESLAAAGELARAPELDVPAARARLGSADAPIVLDVRSSAEFDRGHLPGARRIVHTRLAAHIADLPRSRPILVNCASGGRSARATALLRRSGLEAINLAGGYGAWAASGAPVEPPATPRAS